MTTVEACPSENTLLDIVVDQRLADLDDHLDRCDACRELVAALARSATRPQHVGRFEVERVLGAGAMGVVYLARDPQLGRAVALKVMHADSPVRAIDEARTMARLAHDNLVTIYEIETIDDHVAIAMEYQAGGTLRDWLTTSRTWREIVGVLRDVARGLAAIHEAGLVHRDLKPDNILFDANGRARITDLGLAAVDGSAAGRGGTPAYMAPEQLEAARSSARSDQWSFFVCLYEALAGHRPFRGATPAALRTAMTEPCATISGVPRALHQLVARGLSLDPDARHPTMAAVARALDRLLARRRRRIMIAGGFAVVAIAAGVAWAAAPSRSPPCGGAAEAAGRVWNATSKHRIAAAYETAGMPETGARVRRRLDAYTASWIAMHHESCEASHVRGEQSAPLLDRRTLCLRERLAAAESLLDGLVHADREALARGGEAVAALPPIENCSAAGQATTTAVVHPRGVAARVELARIRALRRLGRHAEVLARAQPLVSIGTEIGDRVLVAEARLVIADAYADDLQLDRARAAFTEAELAAEAAGDDDLRARTLIAHASLAGAIAHASDAEPMLTRARAIVERVGGRPELRQRIVIAEAALAAARGDQPAGERLLREHLAATPAESTWLRAVALRDLANMLGEQGRHTDAAPFAREAVAVAEAALGPDHVELAEMLSVLALTLHFSGGGDADAFAARALAIKERARGADHVSLSSTIMVQALIARDATTATGHADARRLTDRAIALRRHAYAADNPQLLALVGERGSLAVEAGEHALARAHLAEALPGLERAWGATSPAVLNARASLATLAEQTGDPAGCATELAAIVDPPFALAIHHARCLFAARDFDGARRRIDAITRRELADLERAEVELLSARLAHAIGARARARTLVAEVMRRHPPPSELALEQALVWAELGDGAAALALVEPALAATGEDLLAVERYLRAGEIAIVARRAREASRYLERARAIAQAAEAGPDLLARIAALRAAGTAPRPALP